MKNKKLPRRGREKLRQRQEMFAAALELFSVKGYHNVSMHEIAEKTEFAIGTLYKLAVALDSITNVFLFLWLEAPERHPYPEDPGHILDIILKGLVDPRSGDELC